MMASFYGTEQVEDLKTTNDKLRSVNNYIEEYLLVLIF